nr:hypothetical protein [Tanacetum cinerariifolium]
MKEEFLGWFGKHIRQRHVDNDPGVNESSELFALACGPSQTPISVNSCVVNGVRFVVHSRDERRTTQNSGICSPGLDEEMYFGQLEQILEFSYLSFKTVLFRVKWFDTGNKGRIQNFVIRNNITQIKANGEAFKNDQYILATQVKQCFYLEDMARRPPEEDPDVIHVDNSSDLALSTSLNDLEITALHIDGQSIDVDIPPDIIDMSADVTQSYGDESGGEDCSLHTKAVGRLNTRDKNRNLSLKEITDMKRPVPIQFDLRDKQTVMPLGHHVAHWSSYIREMSADVPGPTAVTVEVRIAPSTPCKGKRNPNLGGRVADRLNTRDKTRNVSLKEITDTKGPVPIQFELRDKQTVMPLGDHAAQWSSYIKKVIRGVPLYYPSWLKVPKEQKAALITDIGVS